jgi:hypothetical protein
MQFRLGRPIGVVTDLRATFFRRSQVIAHDLANKGRWLRRVPMRGRDLHCREPDKAVAAFQRVVEESEFVVACECRQPQ